MDSNYMTKNILSNETLVSSKIGNIKYDHWLSLKSLLKYEPYIIKANVSRTARSKGGFLYEYKIYKTSDIMKKAKVPDENQYWETKRNAFIARTLAAYKENPTYRRWLSLIAWAYLPKKLH